MSIKISVSPGEVVDKIVILQIKQERIGNPGKLRNINTELALLRKQWAAAYEPCDELETLTVELKQLNEQLWVIENDIRECERRQQFDDKFIQLARAVYLTNDQRAAVKRQVNELFGSEIIEEKSYAVSR